MNAAGVGIAHSAAEKPNLQTGLWRVAVAMEIPNATGPSTGPAQYERCINGDDIRNLLMVPEGAGCSMLESNLTSKRLSWEVRCSRSGYASTAKGAIDFQKTRLEGTIITVADGRSDFRITTRLSGRYLGPCVATGKPPPAEAAPPKAKLPDFK